jgi:hypothetical protein
MAEIVATGQLAVTPNTSISDLYTFKFHADNGYGAEAASPEI